MHGFLWTVLGNREEVGGVPIKAWMAMWCINYARRSAASLFDQQADPHGHMFAECAHGVGHGSFVKAGDSSHCTYPAKELQGLPDHYLQLWELSCRSGADHQRLNEMVAGQSGPQHVLPRLAAARAIIGDVLPANSIRLTRRQALHPSTLPLSSNRASLEQT